jgi:GcrA cell cycle regulator
MAARLCGKPDPKGLCHRPRLILWVDNHEFGRTAATQYVGVLMTNGWTEDRVEILKKLWTEGLSASQIAKQLGGVTRNAVIGKVHRLGLAGRAAPSRPVKRISVPIARPRPAPLSDQVVAAAKAARLAEIARAESAAQAARAPMPAFNPVKPKPRPTRDGEIIGVLQLGAHMCKWPIGDPGDVDFGFCGSHCEGSAVYCEEHAAIAFQPAILRRPGMTRESRAASEVRRLARLANF